MKLAVHLARGSLFSMKRELISLKGFPIVSVFSKSCDFVHTLTYLLSMFDHVYLLRGAVVF